MELSFKACILKSYTNTCRSLARVAFVCSSPHAYNQAIILESAPSDLRSYDSAHGNSDQIAMSCHVNLKPLLRDLSLYLSRSHIHARSTITVEVERECSGPQTTSVPNFSRTRETRCLSSRRKPCGEHEELNFGLITNWRYTVRFSCSCSLPVVVRRSKRDVCRFCRPCNRPQLARCERR